MTTTYTLPGNHTAQIGDDVVFGYTYIKDGKLTYTHRRGTIVAPNRYQKNNKNITITYVDETIGRPVFKSFDPAYMNSVAVVHRS